MTRLTLPDWLSADKKLFVQDAKVWQDAQDWAMKTKLISVGSKPDEYFTNAYLPD